MADVKISELPAATAVAATDVAPIVAGGTVTQKATAAQIVKGALDAAPVTLAQGGTGATTAAAAQTALNVPSRTGAGATGTWGISVTGTAQKATDLASGVAGDLPYQAGDTATEFLPIGTAGQVLTVANGLPSWATPASGGVTKIIAGTNVTVSPVGGTGDVTINATGGGSSLLGQTQNVSPFETALGFEAGNSNTGANNTYLGYQAGKAHTGATNSVVIGYQAFDAATIPSSNVVIGASACGATGNSSQNVVIGYNAAGTTTALGGDSVIIGNDAGRTVQGTSNVLIGSSCGNNVTTGAQMVGVGLGCFGAATAAAAGAVAVGNNALGSLTTGARNTAVGGQSGQTLVTGSDNTFVGLDTGKVATGSENTFIGSLAGDAVLAGAANTFVGYNSGTAVTTGNNNTFVGRGAGGVVTTGSNNTVIGNYAGQSATMAGFVILADGSGNQRLTVNNSGAISFNNAVVFGSDGFVLSSRGSTAEPQWINPNVSSVAQFAVNVSMLPGISVYFMNCTSGNLIATLPSASANVGLKITVKRVDQAVENTLTVASAGGQVEGLATQQLGVSVAVQYCSDGTNWWELANG